MLVPILGIAFVLFADAPLIYAMHAAGLVDAKENPLGLAALLFFLFLPFTALILVVFAWVKFVERRPLPTIGLINAHWPRTFVSGHLTGVAMVGAIMAGIWVFGGFQLGAVSPALKNPAALAGIVALLLAFGLQSSAEEILFRGWMMSALAVKFGAVVAVAISSVVFALLHFEPRAPWIFAVNILLFGVFTACWSLRTGNIWGVMGWHAGWNWFLGVGFERPVTGLDAHMPALIVKLTPIGPNGLTGGVQGGEASLVCTVILIAGILLLRPWRRQPETQER